MTSLLAWAGGALFVAALAYTGYFFVVVLGDPAPPNPDPLAAATLVNALVFGLFAAHHSLFARGWVKHQLSRLLAPRFERSAYVWVASLLLIGVLVAWRLVEGTVYRADGVARWVLYLVQLAGVYLTIRGAGSIDPLELAGIRQAIERPRPLPFRTDGPFGLVRHPIYLGWLLMAFGAPTMTVNRLLFAAITSMYLVIAIPWEERSLVSVFGDRYRAYQSHVKWRLIPGLW